MAAAMPYPDKCVPWRSRRLVAICTFPDVLLARSFARFGRRTPAAASIRPDIDIFADASVPPSPRSPPRNPITWTIRATRTAIGSTPR